jgi:hypothetical protein
MLQHHQSTEPCKRTLKPCKRTLKTPQIPHLPAQNSRAMLFDRNDKHTLLHHFIKHDTMTYEVVMVPLKICQADKASRDSRAQSHRVLSVLTHSA